MTTTRLRARRDAVADRIAAYAAAVAHPYHVTTFPDWKAYNGVTVGFQSESEARRFAALRPENLIDLVKRGAGVIATRRLIPHPQDPNRDMFRPRDDFPYCEDNPDAREEPVALDRPI